MLKAADDTSRDVTAGTVTTLSAVLTSRAVEPVTAALTVEVGYTSTYAGEGAEWPVHWTPPAKKTSIELFARKETYSVQLAPNTGVPLSYSITAPVGVRYGDQRRDPSRGDLLGGRVSGPLDPRLRGASGRPRDQDLAGLRARGR